MSRKLKKKKVVNAESEAWDSSTQIVAAESKDNNVTALGTDYWCENLKKAKSKVKE